jgi:hypothetical protein
MKISFPSKEDGFQIHECDFCGISSFLIVPKIDVLWKEDNLFYRSIIVDDKGTVLSCGWPKFFNSNEKPNLYPPPEQFRDWIIHDKLDGSLVIVDYVNGSFNMRTRGCVSHHTQSNHADFELLFQKHPIIKDFLKENSNFSLLFEIVTPNNVIVIRPKEVKFYFLGAIDKDKLQIASRHDLLEIWKQIGCIPSPKSYEIDNIKDLSSIIQLVKPWKGLEGVVISYNNNQNRIKIKSDWYLFCHKIKSQLNSTNNLIQYYVETGLLPFEDFYKKIETDFDYEIAFQLKHEINKICEAAIVVKKYIDNMIEMVHEIRNVESRKEKAIMIKTHYKKNSSYAFWLLDNKPLTNLQWNKLMHQKLNHES